LTVIFQAGRSRLSLAHHHPCRSVQLLFEGLDLCGLAFVKEDNQSFTREVGSSNRCLLRRTIQVVSIVDVANTAVVASIAVVTRIVGVARNVHTDSCTVVGFG